MTLKAGAALSELLAHLKKLKRKVALIREVHGRRASSRPGKVAPLSNPHHLHLEGRPCRAMLEELSMATQGRNGWVCPRFVYVRIREAQKIDRTFQSIGSG